MSAIAHITRMNARPSTFLYIVLLGTSFFFAGFLFDVLYLSSLEYDQPPNIGMPKFLRNDYNMISISSESRELDASYSQVVSNFSSITPVPYIVQSWRAGKLDWHDLIPTHNSKWERFGTPQSEGKLNLLINKEVQVTDYLTRYHESGLAGKYGRDHGKLLQYSACDTFKSPCNIHDNASCASNGFCMWDEEKALCVDKVVNGIDDAKNTCSNPSMIAPSGVIIPVQNTSTCKLWIRDLVMLVDMDSEAQSMYYHFIASWSAIVNYWTRDLSKTRQFHIIIRIVNDPMFYQYFGVISDYCYRRASSQIPDGTCFCNAKRINAMQARNNELNAALEVVRYLGLEHHMPPNDQIKIGLISRRRKRFILNEYELVDNIRRLGYDIQLLPLEAMTVYEQMRELRSLDVLIGIHGSALDNSLFLHSGSVLVQLLPYTVQHRVSFVSDAQKAGVHYLEWKLTNRSNAVFHWDLLQQADANRLKRMTKEEILSAGQIAASSRETLMFWINQDIIVPLEEWRPLVQRAVKASLAVKRGLVSLY